MIFAKCHPERKHEAHGLCSTCARKAYREALKLQGYPTWAAAAETMEVHMRKLERKKIWNLSHREKHASDQARYREKMKGTYGGRPDMDAIARTRWAIDKNERREVQRKRISRVDKDGSSGPHFKTICELLRKGQWTREA